MSSAAQMWDARYRESERIWTREPNPTLIDLVSPLAPGTALDIGCGEGGDAVWLARNGWTTTGVDISIVAIERARELAEAQGVAVDYRQTDLVTDPETQQYDLVTAHFMHLPQEPREKLFAGLVSAVAPGGHLLIVGHDFTDVTSGAHRPHEPGFFYTPDDLIGMLDSTWDVVTNEIRPRPAVVKDGETIEVNDAILLARRGD